MLLTNGEYRRTGPDTGDVYRYRLIAVDGPDSWVQQINGLYKGEPFVVNI